MSQENAEWREYSRNPASVRSRRMRAARKLGTHTAEEWAALQAICEHRCVRCSTDEWSLERDHITPIYQGGSDAIGNIQPMCARCNCSKGADCSDLRPADWLQQLRRLAP